MNDIELICFDTAGTTVLDNGLVLEAFRRTIEDLEVSPDEAESAEAYVVATMGQSKIEVFTALFGERASIANEAFERNFVGSVEELGASEIPGARSTVETLRDVGLQVDLTTGFSPTTRESLVEVLGWGDLFELRVSPADAGRGRPASDIAVVVRFEVPDHRGQFLDGGGRHRFGHADGAARRCRLRRRRSFGQ